MEQGNKTFGSQSQYSRIDVSLHSLFRVRAQSKFDTDEEGKKNHNKQIYLITKRILNR